MATVDGLTKDRMLAIEAASVVSGELDDEGNLTLTTHGGTDIDAGNVMPGLDVLLPAIRDFLYPVGHVYMSVVNVSPATLFGGTWVAWGAGKTIVGVDTAQTEFDSVEKTGGEKTVTLTAAQSGLPAHNHTQNAHNHTQDAHTHTQNAHGHTTTGHSHDVFVSTAGRAQLVGMSAGDGSIPNRFQVASGTSAPYLFSNFAAPNADATTATDQNTTATNQAATATNQAATATNNASSAADASASHNNLQPYITTYMWKRTA